MMHVYVQKSMRTTLPCSAAAVRGGELSQPVAPRSEAKSLALDGLNGVTVIICITESLVPIHAPATDSATIPRKRRRSCRGSANIRLCLCIKGTACGDAVPSWSDLRPLSAQRSEARPNFF